MDRRTSRLIIAVLVVVCLSMLASVVYPVSTATPQATMPSDDQFSVTDREEFRVSATLTLDGRTRLALDGAVTANGPRYSRFNNSGSVRELYQQGPDSVLYMRSTVADAETAERWRADFEASDDHRIIRETDTDNRTVFVVRQTDSDLTSQRLSGSASVFLGSLSFAAYERADSTDTGGTAVYEPQNGWFDESEAYRITDAAGRVRIGNETRVVDSASVEWELTRPADTYAHYQLARQFGNATTRYEITYDLETAVSNVSRPDWVPETHHPAAR